MRKCVLLLMILFVSLTGVAQKKKKARIKFVPPVIRSSEDYEESSYEEQIETYWKDILVNFEKAKAIQIPKAILIPDYMQVDELWTSVFKQDSVIQERVWTRFHILADANQAYQEWKEKDREYKDKPSIQRKNRDVVQKYLPKINACSEKRFATIEDLNDYLDMYSPAVGLASNYEPLYKKVTDAANFIKEYMLLTNVVMEVSTRWRMGKVYYFKRDILNAVTDYKIYKSVLTKEQNTQLEEIQKMLIVKLKEIPEFQ